MTDHCINLNVLISTLLFECLRRFVPPSGSGSFHPLRREYPNQASEGKASKWILDAAAVPPMPTLSKAQAKLLSPPKCPRCLSWAIRWSTRRMIFPAAARPVQVVAVAVEVKGGQGEGQVQREGGPVQADAPRASPRYKTRLAQVIPLADLPCRVRRGRVRGGADWAGGCGAALVWPRVGQWVRGLMLRRDLYEAVEKARANDEPVSSGFSRASIATAVVRAYGARRASHIRADGRQRAVHDATQAATVRVQGGASGCALVPRTQGLPVRL